MNALSSLRNLLMQSSNSFLIHMHGLHVHSNFDWVHAEVERVLLFATLVLNLLVRSLAAALRKQPFSTSSSASSIEDTVTNSDADRLRCALSPPEDGRALSLVECLEMLSRLEQANALWFRGILSCLDSTLAREPADNAVSSALESLRELLSDPKLLADSPSEHLLRLERASVALANALFSLLLLAGTHSPDADAGIGFENSSALYCSPSTLPRDRSSLLWHLSQRAFSDPAQRHSLRQQLCTKELELVRAEISARDEYFLCFYGVPFFPTRELATMKSAQTAGGSISGELPEREQRERSCETERELYQEEHFLRRALPALCQRLEAKLEKIGGLHAFRGSDDLLAASHVCTVILWLPVAFIYDFTYCFSQNSVFTYTVSYILIYILLLYFVC